MNTVVAHFGSDEQGYRHFNVKGNDIGPCTCSPEELDLMKRRQTIVSYDRLTNQTVVNVPTYPLIGDE